MKTNLLRYLLLLLPSALPLSAAEVPRLLNHQGRIAVDGVNFDGVARFKFALVDGPKGKRLWSHDGTTGDGEPPGTAVELPVTKGLYSVMLGDAGVEGMSPIEDRRIFDQPDLRLRIWFDDGSKGFQQLEPDQRLAPGSYLADAAVTAQKIAAGSVGAAALADGSITGSKLAPGADSRPVVVNGTVQSALPNSNYVAAGPGMTYFNLPTNASVGDTVHISGLGAAGWEALLPNPNRWTPRESDRDWRSVASSADGTKLIAAVYGGKFYTSSDSGVTWTPRWFNGNWSSVASSADGTRLLAALEGGKLHVSTNSGESWEEKESIRQWADVTSSADGMKLFAVAPGEPIYRSLDGGTNWLPFGPAEPWSCIACSADGTKLLAGAAGDGFYNSTDSGGSWTRRLQIPYDWRDVAATADGTTFFVVGYASRIWISRDDGVSWGAFYRAGDWTGITSSADGTRVVAVEPWQAGGTGLIHVSNNSGNDWTERETVRAWSCVASSADGLKLVAAAKFDRIYTDHGGGIAGGFAPVPGAAGSPGVSRTLHYAGNGQWRTEVTDGADIIDGSISPAKLNPEVGVWGVQGGGIYSLSNVGIGDSQPAYRLSFGNSVSNTKLALWAPFIGPAYGLGIQPFQFRFHVDGPSARFSFLDAPDGNELLTIQGNGNVGIGRIPAANRFEVQGEASKSTAGAWLANSDRRIKTDIRPVTGALETIDEVKPVTFRYTEEYRRAHPDIKDVPYYNVIAQEFREVFPNAVKESGEKLPDGSEILQVDTYPATITAIAAIKELKAENASLKQRLAALEETVRRIQTVTPSARPTVNTEGAK